MMSIAKLFVENQCSSEDFFNAIFITVCEQTVSHNKIMLLFDPGARSTGLDFSPSERSTLWQNFFESEVGLRDASETTFFGLDVQKKRLWISKFIKIHILFGMFCLAGIQYLERD